MSVFLFVLVWVHSDGQPCPPEQFLRSGIGCEIGSWHFPVGSPKSSSQNCRFDGACNCGFTDALTFPFLSQIPWGLQFVFFLGDVVSRHSVTREFCRPLAPSLDLDEPPFQKNFKFLVSRLFVELEATWASDKHLPEPRPGAKQRTREQSSQALVFTTVGGLGVP